jgi:hypothetical protein
MKGVMSDFGVLGWWNKGVNEGLLSATKEGIVMKLK